MRPLLLVTILLCQLASAPLRAQTFVLKTAEAGLSSAVRSNGVAVADYDLDGDLDVYFVGAYRYDPEDSTTWNRLFRNNGDGTFSDVTVEAGLRSTVVGPVIGTMGNNFGASWGDYDNDGDPDLFLANLGPDELYRNEGDGTFVNVTEQVGVAGDSADHNSSAVWWDYDLDGDLDLYVSAWIGTNRMYENIGDTFVDVTQTTTLGDTGWTWTSVPIDANNDGLPDLYVVNDFGANRLYQNLGNKTFRETTVAVALEDSGNGMGVAVGDYDNNGFFDIYVTNIGQLYPPTPNPLFTNTGDGYFVNKSLEMGVDDAGWAWGTEFFDCDHDGDEDLYVANGYFLDPGRNYLFVNMANPGGIYFLDRSAESGTNGRADARGLVVFDYDEDGDLDLLVANVRESPYLYENQSAVGNWLKVALEGTTANRNAFGAVVRVTAGSRTFHRHYDGVDFLGQSIQPLHFGLANAQVVDKVVVEWPGGGVDSVSQVAVNQTIQIIEGQGLVTGVPEPSRPSRMMIQRTFRLLGNFPNPFNGSTVIEFELPRAGSVQVVISTLLGERVRAIRKVFTSGGTYRIFWDGRDERGDPVSSGLYVYSVWFGDVRRSGRMVYLK